MRTRISSLFVLALAGTTLASPLVARDGRARAVYTLGNDVDGAFVAAAAISVADGTLSAPKKTLIGGNGIPGRTAKGNAGPDPLFGINAIVVSEDYLFTVASGSNLVSMFAIDTEDPTKLTLIGKPQDTLGDFPMAVAYSADIKTGSSFTLMSRPSNTNPSPACVLNGGARAGVSCFSTDHTKGLTPLDTAPRSLAGFHQTTPPLGPPETASNLYFNPTSSLLFAVSKGNPGATPALPSTYYAWAVQGGRVGSTSTTTQIPENLVSFGGDFVDDTTVLIADASFGVAKLQTSATGQLTELVHTTISNQRAVCWIKYLPRFSSVYATDAGRTVLTVLDANTAEIKHSVDYDPSVKGGFDTAGDRTKLYMLTGVDSIAVWELRGGNGGVVPKIVQVFGLGEVAGGKTGIFQGLATYPS
jgi:hypothetical protein